MAGCSGSYIIEQFLGKRKKNFQKCKFLGIFCRFAGLFCKRPFWKCENGKIKLKPAEAAAGWRRIFP